ncbi:holin, partial [Listeria innocua]
FEQFTNRAKKYREDDK